MNSEAFKSVRIVKISGGDDNKTQENKRPILGNGKMNYAMDYKEFETDAGIDSSGEVKQFEHDSSFNAIESDNAQLGKQLQS